ncbi:MAG: hypothetical protein IKF17_00590 [Clostridia bacterium]|nr:hypothetical protein [Clostridia bacterium]
MSNIKRVLIFIIAAILVGATLISISNAANKTWTITDDSFKAKDVNVGDEVTIWSRYLHWRNGDNDYLTDNEKQSFITRANENFDFLCVEAGQQTGLDLYGGAGAGVKYKAVAKVHIRGFESTVTAGTKSGKDKVISTWNQYLACILNPERAEAKDRRWSEDSYLQRAAWRVMYGDDSTSGWMNCVGRDGTDEVPGHKITALYNFTIAKPDWVDKDYANPLYDFALETYSKEDGIRLLEIKLDDAAKNNIKAENIDNGRIKIGPLKYTFNNDAKFKTIEVSGKLSDGKTQSLSDIKYVVYDKKTLKEVALETIASGQEFYITIPDNTELTEITNINATVVRTVYSADIVFWSHSDGAQSGRHSQNQIQFTPDKEEEPASIPWNPELQLFGNLKITKKDYDNSKNISKVTFKLQDKDGKYVKQDKDGKISYVDEKDATLFSTNDNGEVEINKLKIGTYTVSEIKNPNKPYGGSTGDVDTDKIFYNLNISGEKQAVKDGKIQVNVNKGGDEYVNLYIYNEKKYVDITGYVWKDVIGGKDNNRAYAGEDIYADGDVLLEGIKVYLKDSNGNTINEATTNEKGEYKFENVLISELSNYHVEFEYDGLKYTSVKEKVGNDDTVNSKATEIVENRKAVNNRFAEVTNQGDIEKRDSGFSRDSNGNVTGNLGYELLNHIATLKSTTTNTSILATTGDSYKLADLYNEYKNNQNNDKGHYKENSDGSVELLNVNLGIKDRVMPQISLLTDIQSAQVDINGYSHTYSYGQKPTQDNNSFNVGVKFGDNNWPGEYTRAIYPSDIKQSASATEDSSKLKVRVTYQTKIANRSNTGTVSMAANEIVNYHDSRYRIVESWIDDGNRTAINWSEASKYGQKYDNSGFVGSYTQSLAGRKLQPGEVITLYTTYEVNDEAVLDLLNQKATLNNVFEINAYSSYYIAADEGCTENDIYAAVDNASAPGNATPNNKETFEADTDSAPSLILEAKGARTIEGTVFEDETTLENRERKGDGIYDASKENKVSGVTVELIDANTGNVVTVYPPEGDIKATDGKAAGTTTDKNGYYTFRGIEPGVYYIKYTYKNGATKLVDISGHELEDKVTVQDYKSTIITSNTIKEAFENNESNRLWYKENETRYSKARDNYDTRQKIDKGEAIDNLDATTPRFDLGIEYETTYTASTGDSYEYKVADIDFGIAKRPIQSIKLTKPVKHIKVTLPDEQVLVDSDINEGNAPKYVTITDTGIYVTIDNELIYGSKIDIDYEIKVENNSEKDYANETYYYYGTSTATDNPIKFDKVTIADYVDKDVLLKSQGNEGWTSISNKDDLKNKAYLELTDTAKDNLMANFSTVAVTDTTKPLAIDEIESKTISVEKILSSSDDAEFNNNVEVVKVEQQGGIQRLSVIPGNYASRLASDVNAMPEEDDEAMAKAVAIIPPTGETSHIITYAVISVISLAVLGSGIYGIRKYLKK